MMGARKPGKHRQRKRLAIKLMAFVALVFGPWLAGLVWFTGTLPLAVADASTRTDAIVVLTGGSERLHEGLTLLSEERGQKLFVSGVYRGVDVKELLRISQQSPAELECCVVLGYEADSTKGNAIETAGWMREEGFQSLRLVTANYHMRRSLLEFHRVMPDVTIIPHPVFPGPFKQRDWWHWSSGAALLATEFSKYLVALGRGVLP